jgi:ribosome biogenesis GTPase / thiamine phosphate phosphatase
LTQIERGLVVRSQSGFYTVETEHGTVTAHLRGRLKQGKAEGDIVALGDWVEISSGFNGENMIERVKPRLRALVRRDPRPQGLYEQVILANPDQALFLFACADPAPKVRMLDRFLVAAEQQKIPSRIVVTKIDLVDLNTAKGMFGHYMNIGYPVLYTSVKDGIGVDEFQGVLRNKVSVLAGPSGVGKSSLMNAVHPDLDLRVREIREGTRKGKHTTVERQMFKLEFGGYVADTPGLKAFGLWDIEPEELDGYFPEFLPLISQCRYRDCAHLDEPGCAVAAGITQGKVHADRYESYKILRLDAHK